MNEAIRLLGAYTGGRFDIWLLAGGSKASCRAHVMSVLTGQRVPQSKAGVNAIRSAFYARLGVTGEYEAQREQNFVAICKGITQ